MKVSKEVKLMLDLDMFWCFPTLEQPFLPLWLLQCIQFIGYKCHLVKMVLFFILFYSQIFPNDMIRYYIW